MSTPKLKLAEPETVSVESVSQILAQVSEVLGKCSALLSVAIEQQSGSQAVEEPKALAPLETYTNKPAPKSKALTKLETLIKEIRKAGIGYPEIQFQVERLTKKRELATLTDAECEIVNVEFDAWLGELYAADKNGPDF